MPNGGGYEEDVPKWLLNQTAEGQPAEGACSREGTPFQITKSRPQEPLTNDQKIKLMNIAIKRWDIASVHVDFTHEYHRLCDLVLEK